MMRQEEQLLEALWSNEEQARKRLPRRDVSTSRRHQVTTWKSTKPEVNRHHVATSPRRDVSPKFCISSLNARGARDSRASKCVRPDTRIWRTCNTDLENILRFLYWFSYLF